MSVSNMKIYLKVALTGLIVLLLLLPAAGCGPGEESAAAPESEIATVQRGDLSVEITAVGNLALSRTEDLAFDLFYPKGTVEEVLVEAGDAVEEGQVVARLDEDEWDDELKTLKDAVTIAERSVTTKERALTTAERVVYTKELAVSQAEINLQTAENSLKTNSKIKKAYDAIDDIKYDIRIATELGQYYLIDDGSGTGLNSQLAAAQASLSELLYRSSTTTSTSDTAALTLAQAIQTYNEKQKLLDDARIAVEDAEIAVDDARIAVEDAQEDLEDTQEDFDEANAKSPLVKAPFDGFITRVNVEGGDEVLNGTVAVTIADPDKFEAEISVSEMDIIQLEVGKTAWVQVDALGGLSLPAEVTHISPTAIIQQGVVNYKVTVEVKSLEAVAEERQESRQQMMEDFSSGEMPERMKQAIAEGRMTEEQAEEIMERIRSGDMPTPTGGGTGQSPFGAGGQASTTTGSGTLPMTVPENFQLREGLTVTVSIIVSSSTNVLLVPNAAITTRGFESFVQVVLEDGSTEERAIQTGTSDFQFTEVTSGLEEGEEIVVPQGTVTTSTQQNRPGGFMIPGMGRR